MNAIECRGLTMDFGGLKALNQVDVRFEEGKIYGLLGRNGAGKTTLLNCITNRLFPTEGAVTLDGARCWKTKRPCARCFTWASRSITPRR